MTVVATSRSTSPSRNACITAALGLRQAAMHQADAQVRQIGPHAFVGIDGGLQFQRLAFLDQRADQ